MRWLLCCCERRKWAAGSKDRIVQRPSFILFSARAMAAVRGAAAAQCGLLQLRLTKPTTATATVKSGQSCERRRRMKRCHVRRAPAVTPPCNGKGRSDGGLTLNCESSYYIQSSATTVAAAAAAAAEAAHSARTDRRLVYCCSISSSASNA